MNRSKEHKSRAPNPISKASFLSKLTFWWLKPMFAIGMNRPIVEDDIYAVTNSMRSDQNTEQFAKLWESEVMKKNPSILRVMFKIHGCKIFTFGLLYTIRETLAKLIQPICLGGLVSYFAQKDSLGITLDDAYWYASGIVLSTAFITLTYHPYMLYMFKTASKVRVACSGLIYQKSLRLLKSSAEEGQNGKIINLLSNDVAQLDRALAYLPDVLKGPLQALVFFVVIYMEIGVAAIAGMAFLISFIPLQ
ncbi:ATP-binding cassette sub-family C member 4-like, partial [Sitodiplosis mosellana]|uniref:ATP-binding cassette sub-family C member 4-like n=1 Tax=Sitodiplosis mosellana TaxID=263140 RepID=UPI002445283E